MKFTSEKWARISGFYSACAAVGLLDKEIDTLLRCERTLTRWACRECGDGSDWAIERDEETGIPYNVYHGRHPGRTRRRIPDREKTALKRSTKIAEAHGLKVYHQGDPRGCSLYLLRPGDIPEGRSVSQCYNRGIAICID